MSKCNAIHSKYNNKKYWACPKCGVNAEPDEGGFYIVENDPDMDICCDLLHDGDKVECENCGYKGYGADMDIYVPVVESEIKNCGMNVKLVYFGKTINLYNVTEIHYRHDNRNEVAFESDIHNTGLNCDLQNVQEFESTLATAINNEFRIE